MDGFLWPLAWIALIVGVTVYHVHELDVNQHVRTEIVHACAPAPDLGFCVEQWKSVLK